MRGREVVDLAFTIFENCCVLIHFVDLITPQLDFYVCGEAKLHGVRKISVKAAGYGTVGVVWTWGAYCISASHHRLRLATTPHGCSSANAQQRASQVGFLAAMCRASA